jgi:small-conductance mechanosensitive channel
VVFAQKKYTRIRAKVALAYYQKRQVLGVVRTCVIFLFILFAVLFYDIQAFSVLALALGALVITQKENISSLLAYVLIISNYTVGDDVRVGDVLGEIVRISPLQVHVVGKEESGEHNGKKVSVPNYKFLSEVVQMQELKSETYRRIIIKAVYIKNDYSVDFSQFLANVRTFLDEFLPKRNLNQVGSFKSFAGAQYKINFDYDEDGDIVVRIGFISRPHDVVDRKEQIIEFIERLRVRSSAKK